LKKLHHRITDFFKEIDENINMNYTFSIEDISDEQQMDLLETPEDNEDGSPELLDVSNNVLQDDISTQKGYEHVSTPKSTVSGTSITEENTLLAVNDGELPKFKSLTLEQP
jgi:hypothetical protein